MGRVGEVPFSFVAVENNEECMLSIDEPMLNNNDKSIEEHPLEKLDKGISPRISTRGKGCMPAPKLLYTEESILATLLKDVDLKKEEEYGSKPLTTIDGKTGWLHRSMSSHELLNDEVSVKRLC
jgi:hypothetical protein